MLLCQGGSGLTDGGSGGGVGLVGLNGVGSGGGNGGITGSMLDGILVHIEFCHYNLEIHLQ